MQRMTMNVLAALALSACSSTDLGSRRHQVQDGGESDGGNAASGGMGGRESADGGMGGASAGSSGAGGSGSLADGGAGSASTCPTYPPPSSSLYPGDTLTDPNTTGAGECGTTTLAATLARIHADHPDLSDITVVFDAGNSITGSGSFVYPYGHSDGGFAIVLKRGSGDCPAGCIDNEYWYFETRAGCSPALVGHYHPIWSQGPGGSCLSQDGEPMWGSPPPPDPVTVCGALLAPEDMQGTHRFRACGQRVPCAGKATSGEFVDATITVEAEQSASDPTSGTIRITGSGNVLIDGRVFSATFQRRRFAVSEESSNLPSTCPEQHTLAVHYDFEGFGERVLSLEEMATPDCSSPDVYCKGSLQFGLSPVQ